MQKIISAISKIFNFLGFYPATGILSIIGIPAFIRDYLTLKRQINKKNKKHIELSIYPCLLDKKQSNGSTRGHYFHQDLIVARKVFLTNPLHHVDIGSRVDGFVAHVASFRTIEVLDIRPSISRIHNILFRQIDFAKPIPNELHNYTDSASCLHAIEHFGLGRYGDEIDIDGHLIGIDNLHRILNPGGKLYFSTPIGKSRIEFNAHRVFSIDYLLTIFNDKFTLDSFNYVDDNGDFHENIPLNEKVIENNAGCNYGCGIFELRKKS